MTIRLMRYAWAIALVALTVPACDLDQQNPNAPVEEVSVSDPEGIIALAVGMQGQFAGHIDAVVENSALITDEWGTTTLALASYQVLVTGIAIDPSFGTVSHAWLDMYRVIRSANLLIEHAPQVGLGPGIQTGIVALAKLYKGMSFYWLSEKYERAPIDVSVTAPTPVAREQVLAEAIVQLEAARSDLATVTDADLATFRSRVLGTGFDIRNSVDAYLARAYLAQGDYTQALAAARRVNLSVFSVFTYTATTPNPITQITTLGLRYTQPLRSFVEQAEAGDQRPDFWVNTTAATIRGNPDSILQANRKFVTTTEAFPVYLPDEIRLIIAEASARLGDLATAREMINAVRTGPSANPLDPVAGLPALTDAELATEAQVLTQIAYERRYELYMQGLRWGDTRRLDDFIAIEPTLEFFPVPLSECTRNPNAGC
ncbi:MAG: RagB/SusD family nutrient uptake outer membrane protein [Gemmatimonadota bacterium]